MSVSKLSTRPNPAAMAAAEPCDEKPRRFRWVFFVIFALVAFVLTAVFGMALALVFGAEVAEDYQSAELITAEPADDVTDDGASESEPDSTTASGPSEPCSATGYAPSSDQTGMPEAVAAKRAAILATAATCDIVALADLTGELFTASLGGGDPVTLWTQSEARGETPLLDLVRLLDQPYATMQSEGGAFFVWPSAFVRTNWSDLSEAERSGLAVIHSEAELAAFGEFGRYVGYRIVIHESGDWVSFVAGD